MATLELVEKLRQHAHVSYDDARAALDACDDDLLDAIIFLERAGKVAPPASGGSYTTTEHSKTKPKAPPKEEDDNSPESLSQLLRRFAYWIKSVIKKGNRNLFVIHQHEQESAALPVTLLVILLICCFWVVVPLLVVGLFFGFRYSFRGRELEGIGVNRVMDEAKHIADDLKQSVRQASKDDKTEQ